MYLLQMVTSSSMMSPSSAGAGSSSCSFAVSTMDGLPFTTLVTKLNSLVRSSMAESASTEFNISVNRGIEFAIYQFLCSIFVYAVPRAISHYPRQKAVSCNLKCLISALSVPDRSLGSLIVRSIAFADLVRRHGVALDIGIDLPPDDVQDLIPKEEPLPARLSPPRRLSGSPILEQSSPPLLRRLSAGLSSNPSQSPLGEEGGGAKGDDARNFVHHPSLRHFK